MNITKLGLLWSGIKGFLNPFSSIAVSISDYVLAAVKSAGNAAMSAIPSEKKEKIQKWLEVSTTAMGWLLKYQANIPAAWQPQYKETIEAVQTICDAALDLDITDEELAAIEKEVSEAITAWQND